MTLPNILYLHSHDTGRYVQPYGEPVPMPNTMPLCIYGRAASAARRFLFICIEKRFPTL